MTPKTVLSSLALFIAASTQNALGISFIGIGSDGTGSYLYGVNDSGVAVGIQTVAGVQETIQWSASSGRISLGAQLPGTSGGRAYGISANGSIAGLDMRSSDPMYTGWVKSDSGNKQPIGELTGGALSWAFSFPKAISTDGSTVVGFGTSLNAGPYFLSGSGPLYRNEAFRWSASTGIVGIGDLSGGIFNSYANAVSANGNVIVGLGNSASGYEAFRWTASGGMMGLGNLPGGGLRSEAAAVSGDGSIVVGRAATMGAGDTASANEAFRWTQATGMVSLGGLPGKPQSEAQSISENGDLVVGIAYHEGGPSTYFIWDSARGMRDLKVGLNATGWDFSTLGIDISPDGTYIAGTGLNPSGVYEGWVAHDPTGQWAFTTTAVPEPSTYAACFGVGLLGFGFIRRFRGRT